MITETLLGFACLIAKGDPSSDPASLAAAHKVVSSFSSAELAEARLLIQSGACLPQGFENLIDETRERVEKGEIPAEAGPGGPSESCF